MTQKNFLISEEHSAFTEATYLCVTCTVQQ